MKLDELKVRLDPLTAPDEKLQLLFDDAVSFIETTCNKSFPLDETFPKQLKPIVAKYVKFELAGEDMVKSESIAGMSQTFVTKDELKSHLVSELGRLGFRKMRFKAFGGGR